MWLPAISTTKMARKPKEKFEDDGRTIVDMNVEGMRWYDQDAKRSNRLQQKAELQEKIARGEALNRRETIRYTFYATLAGLTVFGFIGGGTVLFVFILWLLMK